MRAHVGRSPRSEPRCDRGIEVDSEKADEPSEILRVPSSVEDLRQPATGFHPGRHRQPDRARHLAGVRDVAVVASRCLVNEERRVLAAKDLDCVEVAARSDDVAGDHEFGIVQEVEASRVALGERRHECVAGRSPGTADPLDVVRLRWGDCGQHDSGQVADVDAHLECRCGCQHVGSVGSAAVLEPRLDPLPALSCEHAGVLCGHDPSDLPCPVEPTVVVGRPGRGGLVAARTAKTQTRPTGPRYRTVRVWCSAGGRIGGTEARCWGARRRLGRCRRTPLGRLAGPTPHPWSSTWFRESRPR